MQKKSTDVLVKLSKLVKPNSFEYIRNLSSFTKSTKMSLRTVPRFRPTWWRLHAGGGIGKARTRAESNCSTQSVGRVAPPLA